MADQPEDPEQTEHAQNEDKVHNGHSLTSDWIKKQKQELYIVWDNGDKVDDVL